MCFIAYINVFIGKDIEEPPLLLCIVITSVQNKRYLTNHHLNAQRIPLYSTLKRRISEPLLKKKQEAKFKEKDNCECDKKVEEHRLADEDWV